jgi:ADP-heptose:LPS heptosyltransferase
LDEAPTGVQVADGLSLAQLRDLLGRAALFVGNDSGPMHLAAALGTPCLALFGPNLEERSGPWPLPSTPGSPHRTLRVPVPCSPCAQDACLQPGDWCMEKLGLDAVEAQALTMLNATQ